jgi:formylglycine-generating enzyme required for sulfatase activity
VSLNHQIPPPINWQVFENLCADLFGRIIDDKNITKHGRPGLAQDGIDIYGCNKDRKYVGIQCKGKSIWPPSHLSISEINKEIKKATKFAAPLDIFYIATTALNDSKITTHIANLNNNKNSELNFEIYVFSWKEISRRIFDYPDIYKKYWPEFQQHNLPFLQNKIRRFVEIIKKNRNYLIFFLLVFCCAVIYHFYQSTQKIIFDCDSNCPKMLQVKPGKYLMGSNNDAPVGYESEYPQHEVEISKPLMVSVYEITVQQFGEFVKDSGPVSDGGGCEVWTAGGHSFDKSRGFETPAFSQEPQNPAVCVSWTAAIAYADWLTHKTGKPYRLLSEAEWEYVARSNSHSEYGFGDDESEVCAHANGADLTQDFQWGNQLCRDGVGVQTAKVGSYLPNGFGFFDMIGNAAEWVQDCRNDNYQGAPSDGSAWEQGDCNYRGIRGGSWEYGPKDLRVARRGWHIKRGNDTIGFRVAYTVE